MVSPMSNTSVKSTVSVPDHLFLDSRSSMVLSPETRTTVLKAPPPPLTHSPSPDPEKGGAKPRKRPRVGHMMPQNYFPFKLHSLLTLAEKFGFQVGIRSRIAT